MGYTHYLKGGIGQDYKDRFPVFAKCVKWVVKDQMAKGVLIAREYDEHDKAPVNYINGSTF